jgi:pyroglutamyl-peptidase
MIFHPVQIAFNRHNLKKAHDQVTDYI